ncbi:hypothetical protein BG61_11695 [Caballeronia glathei]|uniref:Uncharacterized protein n=1 Tax=Caballeronia glathei TaxID=60547 RepID=A0A069PV89_9BURK|nr:hypothetical protein BG61_11695 [Caballeronia glathei]
MVEQPHVDERERVLKRAREAAVVCARRHTARRVIMRDDQSCRIQRERPPHDFTRIDGNPGDGAARGFLREQQLMPCVEIKTHENLILTRADQELQIVLDGAGGVEQRPVAGLLGERAAAQLGYRQQLRRARRSDAAQRAQFRGGGVEDASQGTEMLQELAREVHGRPAGDARMQEQREELGVGKRGGAVCEQPLARTLTLGPVANRRDGRRGMGRRERRAGGDESQFCVHGALRGPCSI